MRNYPGEQPDGAVAGYQGDFPDRPRGIPPGREDEVVEAPSRAPVAGRDQRPGLVDLKPGLNLVISVVEWPGEHAETDVSRQARRDLQPVAFFGRPRRRGKLD